VGAGGVDSPGAGARGWSEIETGGLSWQWGQGSILLGIGGWGVAKTMLALSPPALSAGEGWSSKA